MVKLSVLLVRCAETEEDRFSPSQLVRVTDATVNAELKKYIANQADDEAGRYSDGSRSLSARMDPPLTPDRGFEQAQDCMTALLDALVIGQPRRKIAFFTAPNKACVMSAFMMSCADIAHEDRNCLTWRLTTFDGATAPAAIPIVLSDSLCNADPDVMAFGGAKAAVDAGIFHCAGRPFNDGRPKCPLMKGMCFLYVMIENQPPGQMGPFEVVAWPSNSIFCSSLISCCFWSYSHLYKVFKKIKEATQQRIDDWDETRDPETGKKIHAINHVQYFRISEPNDPWSLTELVPKINLLVDVIEPKKYMLTPRQGMFDPKKHFNEWKDGIEPSVRQTVWWARQAGCDTVIIVVTDHAMKDMCQAIGAGGEVSSAPPSSIATFVAEVGDMATSPESMRFSFFRFATLSKLKSQGHSIIPPFSGQINELKHPHEGMDPGDAPKNKWAAFPDPEPEVIPPYYPELPPFVKCLEEPLPPLSKIQINAMKKREKEFGAGQGPGEAASAPAGSKAGGAKKKAPSGKPVKKK